MAAKKKATKKASTRRSVPRDRVSGRSGQARSATKADKPRHGPGKKPKKTAERRVSTTRAKTRHSGKEETPAMKGGGRPARKKTTTAKGRSVVTLESKGKKARKNPSMKRNVQKLKSGRATQRRRTVQKPAMAEPMGGAAVLTDEVIREVHERGAPPAEAALEPKHHALPSNVTAGAGEVGGLGEEEIEAGAEEGEGSEDE